MDGIPKSTLQVEIWQAQNYWPIKGWSSSLSGVPHFACHLLPPNGAEVFPEDLTPPQGWSWSDKWTLDMSGKFGQPDPDGWYYASTFDRLGEMMKNASAVGVASKTSLVRKRRWVRSMTCTSSELNEAIQQRIEHILSTRRNIESTLKEKEQSVRSARFYEENRSFVFSQSLHLATQGTLNTLSLLKDIGTKLKSLKLYLHERAVMEREHAFKLESVAKKYWSAEQSGASKNATQRKPFQASMHHTAANAIGSNPTTPMHTEMNNSLSLLTPMSDQEALDCYELFFGKMYTVAQSNAMWLQDFSNNIMVLVTTEIDQMLLEIQSVLKETRQSFRKNSDICRLSEAAIRNFLASISVAYESVNQASLRDISELSDELNGLKGGVCYSPTTLANVRVASSVPSAGSAVAISTITAATAAVALSSSTSAAGAGQPTVKRGSIIPGADIINGGNKANAGNNGVAAREDIWLCLQRYKLAVRDSQEALCVLISEAMDLELQHQIFANRVHHLFSGIVKNYCHEEIQTYTTLHGLWAQMMKETTDTINDLRVPFPVIQSPFAQLNLTLDDPAFLSSSPTVIVNQSGTGGEDDVVSMDSDDDEEVVLRQHEDKKNGSATGGSHSRSQSPLLPFTSAAATVSPKHLQHATSSASTGLLQPQPQQPYMSPNKEDLANFAIGLGVFSFTYLYREPLPRSPGVVRSGDLLYAPASAFQKSKNVLFDGIWKTSYVVATTDGYVHVLFRKKSDIPDRSFYLRETVVNESLRESSEHAKLVFELSVAQNTAHNKAKAMFQEGLYFRCRDEQDCAAWLADLNQLTLLSGTTDEGVENAAKLAMLESLPILKGETAKIDLELQKYEEIQQQFLLQQQQYTSSSAMLLNNTGAIASNVAAETSAEHEPKDSNSAKSSTELADMSTDQLVEEDDDDEGVDEEDVNTKKKHLSVRRGVSGRADEFGVALLEADSDEDEEDGADQGAGQTAEGGEDEDEKKPNSNANNDDENGTSDNAGGAASLYTLPKKKKSTTSSSATSSKPLSRTSSGHQPQQRLISQQKFDGHGSTAYTKRQDSSWASSSSSTGSGSGSGLVGGVNPVLTVYGVTPVNNNMKPPQLIPVVDRSVPLARKHSTLIAQYEQGLLKSQEKVALRVNETRGRRLQDVESLLPDLPPGSPPPPAMNLSPSLLTTPVNQNGGSGQSLVEEEGKEGLVSRSLEGDLGMHANEGETTGGLASLGGTLDEQQQADDAAGGSNGATNPDVLNSNANGVTKKPRRLVKTLSQKFDMQAFAQSQPQSH